MRRFPVLAFVAMTSVFPRALYAADQPVFLNDAQVKELFSRVHTETGTSSKGQSWSITSKPDGSLTLSAGSYQDTGHGVVKANTSCLTWNKIKGETCWRYSKVSDKQYESYWPDGTRDSVFIIEFK